MLTMMAGCEEGLRWWWLAYMWVWWWVWMSAVLLSLHCNHYCYLNLTVSGYALVSSCAEKWAAVEGRPAHHPPTSSPTPSLTDLSSDPAGNISVATPRPTLKQTLYGRRTLNRGLPSPHSWSTVSSPSFLNFFNVSQNHVWNEHKRTNIFLATDRGGGCYEYIGEMGQILGSSRSQSGGGRGVWPMLGWAMLRVGMAGYKVAIVAVSQGILIWYNDRHSTAITILYTHRRSACSKGSPSTNKYLLTTSLLYRRNKFAKPNNKLNETP